MVLIQLVFLSCASPLKNTRGILLDFCIIYCHFSRYNEQVQWLKRDPCFWTLSETVNIKYLIRGPPPPPLPVQNANPNTSPPPLLPPHTRVMHTPTRCFFFVFRKTDISAAQFSAEVLVTWARLQRQTRGWGQISQLNDTADGHGGGGKGPNQPGFSELTALILRSNQTSRG